MKNSEVLVNYATLLEKISQKIMRLKERKYIAEFTEEEKQLMINIRMEIDKGNELLISSTAEKIVDHFVNYLIDDDEEEDEKEDRKEKI